MSHVFIPSGGRMNKDYLALGMLAVAAVWWSGRKLWDWWKSLPVRSSSTSQSTGPELSGSIHSDQTPPVGMSEFVKAIIEACGTKTTPEFKLEQIQTPNITIAQALRNARIKVEGGGT